MSLTFYRYSVDWTEDLTDWYRGCLLLLYACPAFFFRHLIQDHQQNTQSDSSLNAANDDTGDKAICIYYIYIIQFMESP